MVDARKLWNPRYRSTKCEFQDAVEVEIESKAP